MKLAAKLAVTLILLSPLQLSLADTTMDILREKVAADKKLLVAANMELTDEEAKRFWPIYESKQQELAKINQRVVALIKSYAADYSARTLTDDKAAALTKELIAIQQAEVDVTKKYVPKLEKALSKIKVARYLQLENKIRAALHYELAEGIPLAE